MQSRAVRVCVHAWLSLSQTSAPGPVYSASSPTRALSSSPVVPLIAASCAVAHGHQAKAAKTPSGTPVGCRPVFMLKQTKQTMRMGALPAECQ
jgi:hypothetical protein